MTRRDVAQVVIAAGGLGTRVASWSAFLPKELAPVDGQPGLVHLLEEISALGPARVVLVYHPYYRPFIRWARRALTAGATARYRRAAGLPITHPPRWEHLDLAFMAQRGAYADVTSVLNGATRLRTGDLFVAFADNLYPHDNPLLALRAGPAGTSVLARPYDQAEASRRGIIVTIDDGGHRRMVDLVEKPDPATSRALEQRHGADSLWLLEGRARLTAAFVAHLRALRLPAGVEPKLSLALRGFCRDHAVTVVATTSPVVDLGVPGQPNLRAAPVA